MDFQDWLQLRFRHFVKDEVGGITLTTTITETGLGADTGNLTATVTTQSTVVAPAPIWLEASSPTGFEDEDGNGLTEVDPNTGYDPTFHKITYIWIAEERTSTSPDVWEQMTGSYPRVINMVTAWNQAYVGYGKRVAMRIPDAGTYRFRCWAVDMQGNTGLATTATVTVQTREAAYAQADRIVVATDSDFTGAPASDVGNRVSSVSALNTLLQAATTPKWVSFKNGDVHDGVVIQPAAGYCDRLDTWDLAGSKVEIMAPAGGSVGQINFNDETLSQQCTFENIWFKGEWDDVTETGDTRSPTVFDIRFNPQPLKIICYNCDFTGHDTVGCTIGDPTINNTNRDVRWMFADCISTSFLGYGFYSFYCNGGEYDFLGTSAYRSHDAGAGPVPGMKLGLRNEHSPLRLTSYQHCYIACSDFFGCSGWSGGDPGAGRGPNANGNVRIFAGTPTTAETPSLIVDRVVNEGGFVSWAHFGQDPDAPEVPGNWLYDKTLTLCTARTIRPWHTAFGGTTRRNCYTWAPNIPYYDATSGFSPIIGYDTDGTGTTSANYAVDMLNYNNTAMILHDDNAASLTDGDDTLWGANYVRENSINHQPNVGVPVTASAPINTSTATEVVPGVTPRFSGVRWNYGIIDTGISSLANGASVDISYPDSTDGLGNGDATQTDQAYWLALPSSDDKHMIGVAGSLPYRAERGDFTVQFLASVIRITNTSGEAWTASGTPTNIQLHLDRKSRLRTDIPVETEYASPSSVPMPRPQSGSSALAAIGAGDLIAFDSFDVPGVAGTARTRTDAGAVEAV